MLLDRTHFEAMLVLLYKLEEFEACAALVEVLKRLDENSKTELTVDGPSSADNIH